MDRLQGRLSRLAGAVTGRVVETIDPAVVLDHVDVDHLVDRVDVNRLLDRIDVERLLARVDVDDLLDRISIDELLDRVDVNRLLDRVDVDRILERVDLEAAIRRGGVPGIVAESTGRMAGSALDLVRRQLAGLDVVVDRIVVRLLGRDPASQPTGPVDLDDGADHATDSVKEPAAQAGSSRLAVTGHYAGPISRAVATVLDIGLLFGIFTLGAAGIELLVRVMTGLSVADDRSGGRWVAGLAVWTFVYLFGSLAVAGATPGKGIVGLRVVTATGSVLAPRWALVRTLSLPLSAVVLGLGFVGIAFGREHRALHDLVAGTAVVYDWGGRAAELSAPLSAFLSRRAGPEYTGGPPHR